MDNIISYCESEEGNFLDDSFPPTIYALLGEQPGEEQKQQFLSKHGVVGWSRLSDMCDEPQVFPEHISSQDIIQACASHTWLIQVRRGSCLSITSNRNPNYHFTLVKVATLKV